MAQVGKKMLLAEISRLEGLLSGNRRAEEVKDETACKAKKSSEDLVDDLGIDKDMGDGAPVAGIDDLDLDFGEEPTFDSFDVDFESDPVSDELLGDYDGIGVMDSFVASETESGIEDEISQDSLSEVQSEVGADNIPTNESTKDVVAYDARLAEASARLDRVASYVEKQGDKRLAFRLDRMADMIDQERKKLRSL